MLRKANKRIIAACVLSAMAAASLLGQATTAAILGTVTDPTGAAVPGAMVTVTNTGTGIAQTAASDERGRYRVPSLSVGQYEVKAELATHPAGPGRLHLPEHRGRRVLWNG